MTLSEYFDHYFSFPDVLFFLLISTVVLVIMQLILFAYSKIAAPKKTCAPAAIPGESDDPGDLSAAENAPSKTAAPSEDPFDACYGRASEMYYELMFASTSILFFTGLYFLISYHYFTLSSAFYRIWDTYDDFLLLAALVVSILMTDILDTFIARLRKIDSKEKSSIRMAAMLYMLIVFAYIKFVYEDSNYDDIIFYFIVMLIGRFIYFDASFKDFLHSMIDLISVLPVLCMVLASTGLMALYGFSSGYLLRGNGVVVSLWIAHIFLILEICIVFHINQIHRIFRTEKKKNETMRVLRPSRTDRMERTKQNMRSNRQPADRYRTRTGNGNRRSHPAKNTDRRNSHR